jgi:hypothetical protein
MARPYLEMYQLLWSYAAIIIIITVIISEKTLGLYVTEIRMIDERTSRLPKHCAEHIAKLLLYLLNMPEKG